MADTTTTDPQSTAGFDLFLSYRRCDVARVQPLVDALRARGLRVWQDVEEIDTFESIQRAIQTGLAHARALLVWYSATYNDSRACQWELTSAYLAAQTDPATSCNPRCRILVVNPEASATHIVLPALFDQQHLKATELDIVTLADRIADHLARNVPATLLGHLRALVLPRMFPHGLLGSTRFVGRLKWMWQLHATLQAGEAAMLTGIGGSGQSGLVQVRGTGGIGKSLLAEEYALRFGAAYPGGIFWLRAEGYTDRDEPINPTARLDRLEGQIIGFAQQLELPISGLSPLQVKGVFAGHLRRKGKPFLWIVDDLPADPGPAGLGSWLAPDPLGRTLITTRARRFNHVSLIELPQLDESEALQLISRGGPLDDANHATALAICSELGHHALAVDVAAALIEQRGYAKFLDRLRRDSTNPDVLEIAAALDESLPNGHQRSIAATLLASIDELDESALDVLRLAALLADAPIPRDLIWRSIAQADTLDADDAQDRCDPAISRTVAASLADKVEGGIAVHTLVSRTVRLHKQDEARTESLRVAAVVVLNQEMPRVKDIREHVAINRWVPHAQIICANPWNLDSARLLGWVANFHFVRGDYADSIRLAKKNTEALDLICGPVHVASLEMNALLGRSLRRNGNLEDARILHDKNLSLAVRCLGLNHPLTIAILGDLAAVIWSQGKWAEARYLQEVVRNILPCVQAERHPGTMTALSNLAVTLFCSGALHEARLIHESVLKSRTEALGADHQDTLISMSCLALVLREQNELVAAEAMQSRALCMMRNVLGDNHPDTLTLLNNYAITLAFMGRVDEARIFLQEVVAIREKNLGLHHADTLSSLSNLADCYSNEKDSKMHFSLRAQIFRESSAALGGDHPSTIMAMCNFAIVLWDAGEKIKALKLLRTALRRNFRILGMRHDNTIMCAGLLCGFLRDFGHGDLSDFIYKKHLAWMGEPAAHEHQFGFHTREVVDVIRKHQLTLKAEPLAIIRYEFKIVAIVQNLPD